MNILLAFPAIAYFLAAWSDWKTRKATNWFWILLTPIAIAYAILQGTWISGAFGLSAGVIFYALGTGGADAKALMVAGFFFRNHWLFLGLFIAALLGSLAWTMTGQKRVPFLIPLGSALEVGFIGS